MNILCDVDGVCANHLPEWVRVYNKDWNDNLDYRTINEWDMTKFVKPECGTQIYKYLSMPGLYDKVHSIPGAYDGVEYIRSLGHRVIFVTAGAHHGGEKYDWLRHHKFNPGKYAEDFVVAYDKSLIRGDMIIDDRYENVYNFGKLKSILFDAPYNQHKGWAVRCKNWNQIIDWINILTKRGE